jgi:hypothetical protein
MPRQIEMFWNSGYFIVFIIDLDFLIRTNSKKRHPQDRFQSFLVQFFVNSIRGDVVCAQLLPLQEFSYIKTIIQPSKTSLAYPLPQNFRLSGNQCKMDFIIDHFGVVF